ncbi:MAG TPA: hypothetical protein VFP12_06520 [Allosphingosinicella sp.]|nr:hypothetical protein [Allosphingosinicella sp.]
MRNPGRKALYCLLALIAGTALIWFGALRHERLGEDWTSFVPLFVGFALAPFGFVFLIQALFSMRGAARLMAGHRVIARWHVYPAEWEQFRKLDARRAAGHSSLANDLWIRKARPSDPIEVIVGETGLLVDRSYHGLRRGGLPELREVGWLEGPPTCLEFALLYPRGRYGGTLPMTLRVPVPPSARADARRVVAYFEPRLRRKPGLALRNPRRTYWICGIMVAAAAVAGPVGYALARAPPEGMDPLVALTLLIGAVIGAVFAILLALATFLLTWRS